jgi:type VI protein secretion system component Hcp
MSTEHEAQLSQFTANRRDVIRTATGLAAAAVAGGALVGGTHQANAQGNPKNAGLLCEIDDIGQFEILSFSWGMASEGDTSSGGGAGARRMTKADIIAELHTGSVTPGLQLACAQGRHFQRAVVTQTDNRGTPYLTYTLEDVIVSSYQTTIDKEKGAVDLVSFSFGSIVRLMVDGQGYEWNFATATGGAIG